MAIVVKIRYCPHIIITLLNKNKSPENEAVQKMKKIVERI